MPSLRPRLDDHILGTQAQATLFAEFRPPQFLLIATRISPTLGLHTFATPAVRRAFFFYLGQHWCKKIPAVTTTSDVRGQDDLYQQAASEFGAALARLARGYEADVDWRGWTA